MSTKTTRVAHENRPVWQAGFQHEMANICKTCTAGLAIERSWKNEKTMRLFLRSLTLLAAFGAVWVSTEVSAAKDKLASWKEIDDALLRVNDAPVKDWGVYQTGKKRDPLLVQIDKRFLLIQIHERQIFEINPAKVQHKSDELLFDPSDHPAQPLTTTDWDANDSEAVYRLRAKISGEDHLVDIQLPHMLDLSGMPPRSPAATRHR